MTSIPLSFTRRLYSPRFEVISYGCRWLTDGQSSVTEAGVSAMQSHLEIVRSIAFRLKRLCVNLKEAGKFSEISFKNAQLTPSRTGGRTTVTASSGNRRISQILTNHER